MKYTLLCCVLALSLTISNGVVHWNIWEIQQHHNFFPSKSLEEERLTIEAAVDAVEYLSTDLNYSLFKVVDFQKRELQTALRQTAGTHNEDCIQGLSTYMDKAVQTVISSYEECTEEVLPRLSRTNRSLESQWNIYNSTYKKALDNLKYCVSNYANNKDSEQLIARCVKSQEDRYFNKAESTARKYNIDYSPAMTEFRETFIECIGASFNSVVDSGFEFLRKMKCCTNSTAIQYWNPVNNTLKEQIRLAIQRSKLQASKAETEIKELYSSQLLTAEKYLNNEEPAEYFHNEMYSLLRDYFHSVNTTGLSNPGEWACIDDAKACLHNIAKQGGSELSNLDKTMREKSALLLKEMTQQVEDISSHMPSIGNVAILECFSQGYIFAPNTIHDCFQLTYSKFDLLYTERFHSINEYLVTLDNYVEYFRDVFSYPTVKFAVDKKFLEADRVLYNLQRCLYKSSATVYSVTTPALPTTTVAATFSPTTDGTWETITTEIY